MEKTCERQSGKHDDLNKLDGDSQSDDAHDTFNQISIAATA
jgi:hypothetical protein